MGTQEPVL